MFEHKRMVLPSATPDKQSYLIVCGSFPAESMQAGGIYAIAPLVIDTTGIPEVIQPLLDVVSGCLL